MQDCVASGHAVYEMRNFSHSFTAKPCLPKHAPDQPEVAWRPAAAVQLKAAHPCGGLSKL